jgi:hypothetical protein
MFAMTQPRNPRNSFHKQQVWFGLRMTRTLDPGQSPIPSYILVRIPVAQNSLTTGSFHVKADVNGVRPPWTIHKSSEQQQDSQSQCR